MAQDPTLPPSGDGKTHQKAFAVGIVRVTGAFFMIGGTAFGFNVFGIAETLGVSDAFMQKAFGGAIFAAGVIDFMLMPRLLDKSPPR